MNGSASSHFIPSFSSLQLYELIIGTSYAARRRRILAAIVVSIFISAFYLLDLTNDDVHRPPRSSHVEDMVLVQKPLPIHTRVYAHTVTVEQTITATVTSTEVIQPAATVAAEKQAMEPVVFSLIMHSEDAASEGATLIKSIFMYSTRPIHLHIICDGTAQKYLEERIALVHSPMHDVRVFYYMLSYEAMQFRIDREGTIFTDHSAGIPGLMKLFIHELLPASVRKSIYVDTDAFFISDPALLWDVFTTWSDSKAISIPYHPEHEAPEWHNAAKICSCIMLLDLERLRELRLMDSSAYHGTIPSALGPPAFSALYGPPSPETGRYSQARLGDQGYWWAIVRHRPDIFEPLNLDWEVTSCLQDMYLTGAVPGEDAKTEEAELRSQVHNQEQLVLPKLVHFNCLQGTPRYHEWSGWSDPSDSLTKRWGPTVEYHFGYKWIWLNQANDGVATVVSQVTPQGWKFADELFLSASARS